MLYLKFKFQREEKTLSHVDLIFTQKISLGVLQLLLIRLKEHLILKVKEEEFGMTFVTFQAESIMETLERLLMTSTTNISRILI